MSLNVGIVGTGGFTDFHCKILSNMEGLTVKAICGTSVEKAERAARNWLDAKAYSSVEKMIDENKLDAVYICVPPMAHGEIEHLLIDRNIPFFVEKPLGLDLELPLQVLAGIKQKDLITSVGYHFRYMDGTARALECLQGRKIGMALGYFMGSMPQVPWWRKQEGSGGQLIEQTTHIVDLLRYTLGEADEIYAAYASRVMHEALEGVTVADVGTVTIKLASGAVATISNTCILPEGYKSGLEIYTDQGVLELRSDCYKEISRAKTVEYKNTLNPYVLQSEAFLHAVKTGDRSKILSPYEDAVKTQEITVAALSSANTGLPVKMNRP